MNLCTTCPIQGIPSTMSLHVSDQSFPSLTGLRDLCTIPVCKSFGTCHVTQSAQSSSSSCPSPTSSTLRFDIMTWFLYVAPSYLRLLFSLLALHLYWRRCGCYSIAQDVQFAYLNVARSKKRWYTRSHTQCSLFIRGASINMYNFDGCSDRRTTWLVGWLVGMVAWLLAG